MDGWLVKGPPTDAEIHLLREKWPDDQLTVGQLITYKEVELVIKERYGSSRWYSVTNRWRNLVLRENDNIVLGVRKAIGFLVLDDTEKLDLGQQRLKTAVRTARKGAQFMGRITVANLNADERKRLLGAQKRSAAILGIQSLRNDTDLPTLT